MIDVRFFGFPLCRTRIPNMHLREQLRSTLFATCVRDNFPLLLAFGPFGTHNPRCFHPHPTRSSDPLSAQRLAKGDVVKLHLGAHIDGFAAISAETIVVGATPGSPVTGRRADALRAAWSAAEVAMRLVRVGNKNTQVTETVGRVAAAWDCKPVEGMCVSCFSHSVDEGIRHRRKRESCFAETNDELKQNKACCRASRHKT
jgi:methionine aminopeptidase